MDMFGSLNKDFRDFYTDVNEVLVGLSFKSITALSIGGAPLTGTVVITIDGDDLGGDNTIDLSTNRTLECSGVRPFCNVTIHGLTNPVRLFFRE